MIDKKNPIPRYLQVKQIIEDRVRTGSYRPGLRIPGERELADELGVSQMTVNKSILEMVGEGWLYREHGRGTFVPDDFRAPVPAVLKIGIVSQVEVSRHAEDFYVGSLFRGMQQAIADSPVSLSIMAMPDSLYERLSASEMDGFLIADLASGDIADAHRLVDAGKRLVVLSASWPQLRVPFVDSDNRGGAKAAMDHLLDLGHRRIAGVFTLLPTANSLDRLHAWEEALRERSIHLSASYVIATEGAFESIEERTAQVRCLLSLPERPTAFFCAGYYSALETLQAVRAAGLRVPEDVSITAFDDPVSAAHITPPLTTVRQPLEAMGRAAMEKLLRWLRTGDQPNIVDFLPTHLIVRGSTAPPSPDGEPR
jgi:GntR family transcriptional regulator of arabinose operon